MPNASGGGSATNAGIDFQQRVSAWFLCAAYTGQRISQVLDLPIEVHIRAIAYESADFVDDLRIDCDQSCVIYLQIRKQCR